MSDNEHASSKDFVLIMLATFFFMGSYVMVTPLLTGFAESLGSTHVMIGLIGGVANIVALFFRPFVGAIIGRHRKVRLCLIAGILQLLGAIGYYFLSDPFLILICRILAGAGYAMSSLCLSTWVAEMMPPHRIGYGIAMYGTMNALAMGLAPAFGVLIYQHLGYRMSFALDIFFVVVMTLLPCFIKHSGNPPVVKHTPEEIRKARFQFFLPAVLPVAVISLMFTLPYYTMQTFIVRYTEVRHIPVMVSLFFPCYAIVLFLLRLGAKSLFDRVAFIWFMLASSLSAGIGYLALVFMEGNMLMFLGAACMAGGFGFAFSVCQSHAIIISGEDQKGLANSTFYIGVDIGMSTGPFLGAMLWEYLPIEWFFWVLFLFAPATPLLWLLTKPFRRGPRHA